MSKREAKGNAHVHTILDGLVSLAMLSGRSGIVTAAYCLTIYGHNFIAGATTWWVPLNSEHHFLVDIIE